MSADRNTLEQVVKMIVPSGASISHLGTGGFGCTFKVVTEEDVYALKIIDPGVSEASRVDRELNAMRRVSHPGVVRFRDYGSYIHNDIDYRWIEMDFIDGYTLRASLEGGQVFSLTEVTTILRKLVEGASAIWEVGTAHRDLSPGNIMLTSGNDPIIVDLGLARHVDDETLTLLPTPGTPGWMSPEQVSSNSHGDWRSDQFVIGSIGYRLLTGSQPFQAASLMECWMAPAMHQPIAIRASNPDVPNELATIIERMMSKQPFRRYLKASEILKDINAAENAIKNNDSTEVELPLFLANIGQVKNWAEDGFLADLRAGGTIIDMRAGKRIIEFTKCLENTASKVILDPATFHARSLPGFTPDGYKKLQYGQQNVLSPFKDEGKRKSWSKKVWDAQIAFKPDAVISPYFYAGEGEETWLSESLACAKQFNEFATAETPEIWTGILIHSSWLSDENSRTKLLNELTGQKMAALHLLLHTNQPSFAPSSDVPALTGFKELLEVMNDAGVPVIAGKRSTSGLLLTALGAAGWSIGVSANLMNGGAHNEAKSRGGKVTARIYVPQLLNFITVPHYLLMRETNPKLVALETEESADLFKENYNLELLDTAENALLKRHNMRALQMQSEKLAILPRRIRSEIFREWVETAKENYEYLPTSRTDSDNPGFLRSWLEVLS